VSHVEYVDNYFLFPYTHVVDKWKACEKAMEDLRKAIIHDLNNA
jgi:hypothetical protein